ncbi:hypothetical protein AVEN_118126-1 [Araneus ventricosus]|uniref:Uncharacterized protein n=1 Tax=Araneus ventricosus TaxID=182803 RepID=A0A4Y2LBN9_ARAVE|nr:hypothetical protein AVEN_118126-1 [Araneus ventricosus]
MHELLLRYSHPETKLLINVQTETGGPSLLRSFYSHRPKQNFIILPVKLRWSEFLSKPSWTIEKQHKLKKKTTSRTLAELKRKEELEEKQRQEALAELKRKDEVELERLRIEARLKLGPDAAETDHTKLPSREVSKFLPRFEEKEDISLYLILFERQVQRLTIPRDQWVLYLLGLLPPEVSHIVPREADEKANDYDHL